jgi:hypothetical protein
VSGEQDSSPFYFVPDDEAPSPGETNVDDSTSFSTPFWSSLAMQE